MNRLIAFLLSIFCAIPCYALNYSGAGGGGTTGNVFNTYGQTQDPNYFTQILGKIAKIRDGQTGIKAKINCIGDSTTRGINQSTPYSKSYPAYVRDILRAWLDVPVKEGVIWLTGADDRIGLNTDWLVVGGFPALGGVWCPNTSPSATNLNVSIPYEFDTLTVYYTPFQVGATADVIVDGSVIGTLPTNQNVASFTVTKGVHTLAFKSTLQLILSGVEATVANDSAIYIANAGSGSSKTSDWATTTSTTIMSRYQADLTILNLGINDSASGPIDPTVSVANLDTIVQTVKSYGQVLITSTVPFWNDPSVQFSCVKTQAALYSAYCKQNLLPFCDCFNALGQNISVFSGVYGFSGDGHPTQAGYQAMAATIAGAFPFSHGAINNGAGSINTVNGSAGRLQWTQPANAGNKKVVISLSGFTKATTTAITFPIPFSNTPSVTANGTGLTLTAPSTTGITIPVSTTQSGTILIEGI